MQTPNDAVISLQAAAVTPQVQSLTLSSSSVAGGGPVTGTVVLSAAAPSAGAVVSLSSSSNTASVPAAVTVPAGSTSANFTITTVAASSTQSVTITASYGGVSQQASLSVTAVTAPSFQSLTFLGTFQPSGFPSSMIDFTLIPNAGNATYTATIDGVLTMLNGVAMNNGLTFSFNAGVQSPSYFPLTTVSILQVSSASMTFTLSPETTYTGFAGTVSGTLSVTGAPLAGGNAVTLSGAVSGNYFGQ